MTELVAPSDAAIRAAADALRRGRLVAFPTETVYGLGGDATNGEAVAAIYDVKGRPRFNPLIAHLKSADAAAAQGTFDATAARLAAAFWPGPLTLVVPRAPDSPISSLAAAGLDTIALRVPAHTLARELLTAADLPVAAPSANAAGKLSPTEAMHVLKSLGADHPELAYVLDGGRCEAGIESTIVGLATGTPTLLRPGAIAREVIEEVLGGSLAAGGGDEAPSSPGQLASHYAPNARLRLNSHMAEAGEALLAFGPDVPAAEVTLNLSPRGDLREAAANLFEMLRALDARTGVEGIAVMPIPATGLGEAINDRLRRAAAPRPEA